MNNRMIKNATILGICLVCGLVYYQVNKGDKSKETATQTTSETTTNYQTIVMKDENNTLVPIEVDMGVSGEEDQIYRNMLFLMQSSEYENVGLYPVFSEDLTVNALEFNGNTLTMDFNDSLYAQNNEDALDMLEVLSYTFCNDGIEQIQLKINGEEIQHVPNSTVPTSCLTTNLGINNFESDSLNIHRTVPVVVYNQQEIKDKTYYIPTTTRFEVGDQDITNQVSLLLDKIEYPESLTLASEVVNDEGNLKVSLSANILQGNETIDETLYQQLVLSLSSITGVNEVTIYVDDQEILPTIDVTSKINNRIKL